MIDRMDLSNKATAIRKRIGEDESSPIDVFSLAQMIPALTLMFYPLGNNISGACIKSHSSSLIAINSGMSLGRQRFSLAHELYHYYFDHDTTSTVCSSAIGTGNTKEKRADQFASYFLIPSAALYELITSLKKDQNRKLNINEIIRLEQYFGVSHQAMLVRLLQEGEICSSELLELQKGVISTAAKLGFDTSLYKPSLKDKTQYVLGHYILQAERLLQDNKITNGKYEEFLLDAFRDDIVYGEDQEGGELLD